MASRLWEELCFLAACCCSGHSPPDSPEPHACVLPQLSPFSWHGTFMFSPSPVNLPGTAHAQSSSSMNALLPRTTLKKPISPQRSPQDTMDTTWFTIQFWEPSAG